jgi:hypothetical protein
VHKMDLSCQAHTLLTGYNIKLTTKGKEL